MKRYWIKKQKSFWKELWEGAEYLSGFDFKEELDYRSADGSYWSFFLIFKDSNLSKAFKLAEKYNGVVVTLPASKYAELVEL